MTVDEYFDAVKERLLTDPIIKSFQVIRQRTTRVDGYLRARLVFVDESWLEFSEYVQRTPGGEIITVTYSFHWADSTDNLIRRWDNTPHFPDLPGFPHHVTMVSPARSLAANRRTSS